MTTYEPAQPHDSIHVSSLTKQGISSIAAELYEKGRSIQAIATELKKPKASIRAQLIKAGVPLRTHSNNQLQEQVYPRKKSIKTAPYGYCLVAGQLHPDPREQINLQLIIKWWQQGLSHCAIAKSLNKKKIKPRKAKEWSQPTVGFIIKRHKEKSNE